MSLGRLLAAGRSLVGGQDEASRYRMHKHIRLPKFVSPENPFVSDGKTNVPLTIPVAPETNASTPETSPVRPAPDVASKPAPRVAGLGRAVRKLTEWSGKVNPFGRLTKRAGPVKSAAVKVANIPVQGELRLDKVQVVRNDLSDADLEIVPAAKPVVSEKVVPEKALPILVAAGGRESDPSAWSRLTMRIFSRDQRE